MYTRFVMCAIVEHIFRVYFYLDNMKSAITERFIEYVTTHKINRRRLSIDLGRSENTVTNIIKGTNNVSSDLLNRIENFKPEIYDYITKADDDIGIVSEAAVQYRRSTARIYHIPREAAAGDILASMDPVKDDDLELFHMPDLQPGTYFSIYARGDSMENTIYDGELLICSRLERLEDARDGYVHVICSNQVDEGFVVKRIFKKQVGGHVRSLELRSDNPFYPPVTLQAGKIQAIFQVRRTIRARFPPPYKEINEDLIALKNTVDELKNLLDKKL